MNDSEDGFRETYTIGTRADGGRNLYFWCPGCRTLHSIQTPTWSIDDSDRARPTCSPSLLVHPNPPRGDYKGQPRCHLFLRAGQLEFLTDSEHDHAGRTVPLPPLPNYMRPNFRSLPPES